MYRFLVVLETAVNMSVTAVLYIPIVGGFRNRGKHVHHRGIIYTDVGGFRNRGKHVHHRGIIYTGCWWFRKPR